MKHVSLTKLLQPEYDRLVQTIIALGWAHPAWRGPEFKARRRASHGLSGSGCPMRVAIVVGVGVRLPDILQLIAHEFTHVITHDETIDHGPEFRAKLRELVRAHWPGIEPWRETDLPGAQAAYWEDDQMARAIDELSRPKLEEAQAHV
jgi:hypothetical protein